MSKARTHGQRGSALVYILIAIALLAALTVTFMQPSGQQTSSQSSVRMVSTFQSQIQTIVSAIQECVLIYPKGDKSIATGISGTDPSARTNYPIKPNSTHFSTATIVPTSGRLVKDIRCPGDPGNNDENHAKIFGGTSGKFLPPAPDLFDDWQYYNGADGVFIWIETDKSDAFIKSGLEKLDNQYSECEADIINAVGGSVDLDSETPAQTQCSSGHTCFRLRLVVNDTAIYGGDKEADELSCP